MTSSNHLPNRQILRGVIAVVGCDGSGKSTLTADLLARLQEAHAAELIYLGQDSGNILAWVRGIPLIGGAVGRYLEGRSTRAHGKDDTPASPDIVTALVVYLLSRWRYHKFRRLLAFRGRGVVVITDRYPQVEVAGFYFDGPGLVVTGKTNGLVRWLAARELQLYEQMASHVPAVLIRLNIDAATAHARKPDHKLSTLEKKARVLPTLSFNGAHIHDLDSRTPYPRVLAAALSAAAAALAGAGNTIP